MSTELVVISKESNGIAIVTLNDSANRNAMSEAMSESFAARVSDLRKDSAIRVVVLRGAGGAFSGGGHMEMLTAKPKLSAPENRRLMELFYENFLSICSLEVPVIAAINGHAIGAGLCVALSCDIRIAVDTAKLGLNFVLLGLHPGMGATYFVPRLIGSARAAELLYTGKSITAQYAAQVGLVNETVPANDFEATVSTTADAIAAAGPETVRELKLSLRNSHTLSLEECLRREAECQARSYTGKEFLEGISAATEKRKPKF